MLDRKNHATQQHVKTQKILFKSNIFYVPEIVLKQFSLSILKELRLYTKTLEKILKFIKNRIYSNKDVKNVKLFDYFKINEFVDFMLLFCSKNKALVFKTPVKCDKTIIHSLYSIFYLFYKDSRILNMVLDFEIDNIDLYAFLKLYQKHILDNLIYCKNNMEGCCYQCSK